MNLRTGNFLFGLSGFLVFFLLWEFAARVLPNLSIILPPLSKVLSYIIINFSFLILHSLITLGAAISGFLAAAGSALGLVTIFRLSRLLSKMLSPLAASLQFFPKEALSPLFVVVLGLGLAAKVAFVSLICFVPLYIVGMRELLGRESEEELVLRAFGKSDIFVFFAVRFPISAIPLLSASRLAIGLSLVGSMVFELLYGASGLGYLLKVSSMQFNQYLLYATVLLAGVLGSIGYLIILIPESLLSSRFQTENGYSTKDA